MLDDKTKLLQAAKAIGYFSESINSQQQQTLVELFILASEPIRFDGDYDFANSDLAYKIKQQSLSISTEKDYWHTPPIEAMLIHRKLAGLYLLAAKLSAKVNVKQLFLRHTSVDE
jgi:hypothetical protein